MVNTGTWNSDLAFLFVAAFFLPIFLHMVMGVILRSREFSEKTYAIDVYQAAPKPVRNQPKKKKKQVKKPKKKITNEDAAIDGLVKLGYKRSRSRMIVARLCAKNKYQKPEHIIIDAIKCV
jgi:hypothetical protein